MVKLLIAGIVILCSLVICLQVILPAIRNRPLFSWFRRQSRLDKAKQRIRVVHEEILTDELELEALRIQDDSLYKLIHYGRDTK